MKKIFKIKIIHTLRKYRVKVLCIFLSKIKKNKNHVKNIFKSGRIGKKKYKEIYDMLSREGARGP
jgi:hypothetical protein